MTGTLYQPPTWADLALERTFPDLEKKMTPSMKITYSGSPVECYQCHGIKPAATYINIMSGAAASASSVMKPLCESCSKAAISPANTAPARIPTRSALDSALDPILGDSNARRAVVDAVLGVVGAADQRTPTKLQDLLATAIFKRNAYKAELDIANARIVDLEAELAAAQSPGAIRLGEGLTEAQEGWEPAHKINTANKFSEAVDALERLPFWVCMVEGFDVWKAIRNRLAAYETALRASAAPKAEAVTVHGFTITADPARRLVGIDVSDCGAFSPEAALAIADALRSAAGGSV